MESLQTKDWLFSGFEILRHVCNGRLSERRQIVVDWLGGHCTDVPSWDGQLRLSGLVYLRPKRNSPGIKLLFIMISIYSPGISLSRFPNLKTPGISLRFPNLNTPGISFFETERLPKLQITLISNKFMIFTAIILGSRWCHACQTSTGLNLANVYYSRHSSLPGISESRFPKRSNPGRTPSSKFGMW